MKSSIAKKEIESTLASRFGAIFERREKFTAESLATGIWEIDNALRGFPRGAITEIHGLPSSGRTSVLLSALAAATLQQETCALVDCHDTFDLWSASKARVDFDRLLWIRCGGNLERAFKATDLLLQGGGFGLVALNLADVPVKHTRRIISSWWFRFRRALENTLTGLLVITSAASVRSCAALVLELRCEKIVWPSTVSLVSDNLDASVTIGPHKVDLPHHLSLVADPARPADDHWPSYGRLLGQILTQVNRERPALGNNSARFAVCSQYLTA